MTIKQSISLEITKNDKTFVFQMPNNTPLGEAYDAAYEILKEIATMSQQAVEKAARPVEAQPEVQGD